MKKYFYIIVMSLMLSFSLLLLTREPMLSDSYRYDEIGLNLVNGYGYVDGEFMPTMERSPAYPFFLAVIYKIFGHYYFFVQLIQIALFILTVILIYKIAKLIFDEKIAIYSMAITAFFPTLANYPSYILSESFFIFLLSLVVFFGIKVYFTDNLKYYLLLGFSLGLAALCKIIMLPFIFVVILWLIFLKFKSSNKMKFVVKIFIMILAFMILVIPWMSRNYLKFGSFSLRSRSEGPLCVKVQKLNYDFNDFKQSLVFIISENLGKKMYPDVAENPRDFLFREDVLVAEEIVPALIKKGYTLKDIKNLMIAEMAKRPIKFIAVSFLDLLKMTHFTYLPILIDQEYLMNKIINFWYGDWLLSLLRGIFRLLACFLILFSILGMFIKRVLWKNWILLFLLIGYINLSYTLIYGYGRYGVPLIPYYIILSVPTIIAIKEKINGGARRR